MASFEFLAIIIAGLGLAVSLVYYAMVINNQNKTRRLQMIQHIWEWISSEEGYLQLAELLKMQWSDLEDFNQKYGVHINQCNNTRISNGFANSNSDIGIHLTNSNNSIIEGNQINNNLGGMIITYDDDWSVIRHSINNSIIANTISNNNGFGLRLVWCYKHLIMNNDVYNNIEYGIHLLSGSNHTVIGNTANGHKTVLYTDHGSYYTSDQAGIYLESTIYNKILNNEVSDNEIGIKLHKSHNNTIDGNTGDVMDGIINIFLSNYNIISRNHGTDGLAGIKLHSSHYNVIMKNILMGMSLRGIDLDHSSYNEILNNTIYGDGSGVFLYSSSYNIISYNQIRTCYGCFYEQGGCLGNIFENNLCSENKCSNIFPIEILIIILSILAISVGGSGFGLFLMLRKRKRKRISMD